jgi:multidrug efflux pump subunit AcrB
VKGAIAWFAGHRVAANMLMFLILAGGILTVPFVDQEVFPEVDSGMLTVTVEHRGASPEEVETGICIKVEEAIEGVDGIKRISSRALQNVGTVIVEVEEGEDVRRVLDDVKAAVDTIDSFPELAEKPLVQEFDLGLQVINVSVSGRAEERAIRRLAEQVRDELLGIPGITRVRLAAVRPYELSIEVSEEALLRWGLSIGLVAQAVRAWSLDLGGGSVKTDAGEITLRARHQAYNAQDFSELVLFSLPDGSRLLLGDVATVVDGFEDTGLASTFDGLPTAMVKVYRVGDQQALDVSDLVKAYVAEASQRMPDGIQLTTWRDEARVLRGRIDLLVKNGRVGLVLVFLTLALFLRLALAFWVTVGIPISFLGALWLMPVIGVSINMVSLFGFIVALGIVVDDAIVVGENVYSELQRGRRGMAGVLAGVNDVSMPVVFAILTTIAAFAPLMMIPGVMGEFIKQLPLVVVPVLIFSLIESLFILPAHLLHLNVGVPLARWNPLRAWEVVRSAVNRMLRFVIDRLYRPTLALAVEWRYLTLSLGVASVILMGSIFAAGKIRFLFFPQVEADNIVARLVMPPGTPSEVTGDAIAVIDRAAARLADELEAEWGRPMVRHVLASIGGQPLAEDQSRAFGNVGNFSGAHLGEVNVELRPAEDREVRSEDLVKRWRELTGALPDAVELTFAAIAYSTGNPIDIQLTGRDVEALRVVSTEIRQRLQDYPGVYDVSDSFRAGKQELRLTLSPEGEAAGLTLADLARQVRQGFYGEEAQRIQRGRDELRVMVRYPEDERGSLGDVEAMRIRLPSGAALPFSVVGRGELTRADAAIERSDRRRSISITADVDTSVGDPNAILADLTEFVLPVLLADHPGVAWSLEGEQREQADTVTGLLRGFVMSLILIYALLAIPFRSYTQPAIVMMAIPFGIVGAIVGHMLLGMDVTIMSMFGVVALTGVLVNDSLVLVDRINVGRDQGLSIMDAVASAGPGRFRPILLTSLTTLAGLAPLLVERSLQAQFLIPMAVSLAAGVLFGTIVTLVMVPVCYVILHDLLGWFGRSERELRVSSGAA